jgi:hypothetical protein
VHHFIEAQGLLGGGRVIGNPFRHLVLEHRSAYSIQHLGIVGVKFNDLLRFFVRGRDRGHRLGNALVVGPDVVDAAELAQQQAGGDAAARAKRTETALTRAGSSTPRTSVRSVR